MGTAWGVFAPVAIFIPLLRKLDFMEFDDRWKSIHFLSSLTTVVLTVAGFALAVVAANPKYSTTGKDNEQYFTGNMHVTMGVMVLSITVLQAAMGCCIPSDRVNLDDDNSNDSGDNESSSNSSWDSPDDVKSDDHTIKNHDDNNEEETTKKSGPLRTMMVDNKVVNPEGQLVPNRTAYKQYLPKRFNPALQERARKRAESTTILGSAVGTGNKHQVASLTPRKMDAKSHQLEAIEVVDVPDLYLISKMNEDSARNDALVPTNLQTVHNCDEEVSALEDPLPPKTPLNDRLHKKSDFLICWIYTHHLLGLTLFAMALYACHSGIVLQTEINQQSSTELDTTNNDSTQLLLLFWGVTGGIIVLILLVRYLYPNLQNMCRQHHHEVDQPPFILSSSFPPESNSPMNAFHIDTKGYRFSQQQQIAIGQQYDC
jgi:hypothetical protein